MYVVVKDTNGRSYWDGNAYTRERDKATLYPTSDKAYEVRRELGLEKTTILSTAGAELAEMAISVSADCGHVRVTRQRVDRT